jgi:VCBS repeat-containing protein
VSFDGVATLTFDSTFNGGTGTGAFNFTVDAIDDALVEGTETIIATLSNEAVVNGSAALGTVSTTTNVTDSDTALVSIAATTPAAEPGTDGQFTVMMTNPSSTDTVLSYSVGGTATSGVDYTALTGTVTILAGATSATIDVPVLDDLVDEPLETVVVTLTGITSGDADVSLGAPVSATVNLADDDNAPVVTPAQVFVIAEDAVNGASLGNVAGTDADVPTTLQSWTIVSGNVDGIFTINPATGELTVLDNTNLDFETLPVSYALGITVSDGTNTSAVETVTVNVTDVPATITPGQVFVLAENSANTTPVGTVLSTGDAAVSFNITLGNTGGAFAIDNAGLITVANSAALDFETTPSFTLTVEVGDGSTLTNETVTVNLTDVNEAPYAVTNVGSTALEGTSDTVLQGELEYQDPEQGPANVTYTVNTAPVNGQLQLLGVATTSFTQDDINNGRVTYVHDGSETTTDSFTFTLSDGVGGTLAGQSFTFTVTAVNDAPVNTVPGPLSTGLNSPIVFSGANVIAVADADDGGADIQVDLVVGGGNGTLTLATTAGLTGFVGDGTGNVTMTGTVAAINAALDGMSFTPNLGFQGATSVQVTTDDLGNTGLPGPQVDVDTINITVTNTAPTVNDQVLSIDENSALGALVGTVSATDPDLLDPLTYTIISGNTGGAFSIDAATGQIRVADPTLLDFESNPTFTLQVQVTDSGAPGLSDTAIVTIQLNDLIGASDPTDPVSGGGPGPGPGADPEPIPDPTGGAGDGAGGEDDVDLGGDDGGGGNATAEPEAEPQPEPEPQATAAIVLGVDVDEALPGPTGTVTEPAPVVRMKPTRVQVARVDKLNISADTQDTSRPSEVPIVFSEAVEIMSEGVGTTDILEEVTSNPVQAAFKGGSFALSAGFLTWALRGASLIASMAASLPAWQGFDPLPILAAKKRDKKTDEDEKKEDDWQEKRIQRLLNPIDSADKE